MSISKGLRSTKVTLSKDDLFCYRVKDATETIDMFGEDYLDEYGIVISKKLLRKYKKIIEQYEQLQDELRLIYRKDEV